MKVEVPHTSVGVPFHTHPKYLLDGQLQTPVPSVEDIMLQVGIATGSQPYIVFTPVGHFVTQIARDSSLVHHRARISQVWQESVRRAVESACSHSPSDDTIAHFKRSLESLAIVTHFIQTGAGVQLLV